MSRKSAVQAEPPPAHEIPPTMFDPPSEHPEDGYAPEPPAPAHETLPTMFDLPSEHPEDAMPDLFHILQPRLLDDTFRPPNYSPDRVFTASDLYLYYDVQHPNRHKRPDWFAVVDVPRLHDNQTLRLSYVMWQEGRAPITIFEFLSPSTEKEDLGKTLREVTQPPPKWEVYEKLLRVPYYVVFDHVTDTLRVFELQAGSYKERDLPENKLWMPEIQLGIGLWHGTFDGVERNWLRWHDRDGNWISTPVERETARSEQERRRAEREFSRAEQERERAERERQRAERLAERLRALGVNPEEA